MISLEKEGVLVIRKDKNIVGFVHTELKEDSKHRAPVWYSCSKMGFDELIALQNEDGIAFTGSVPAKIDTNEVLEDDDEE